VVVETGSKGEETGSDLVFKRHRSDDAMAPSHSTSSGLTPTFMDNPPSTSSSRDLVVIEDGGESAPEDHQPSPTPELPALLQEALKHFQDKEMVESLDSNLLQARVA